MTTRNLRWLAALTLAALGTSVQAQTLARGVVFHDRNGNGMRDAGEPGLKGMRVSNQREVVVTDASGRYELPVSDDTIIFVVKPRNWTTPVDELGLRRFYYVHKPKGSPALRFAGVAPTGPLPESVDFPLTPRREPDRFRVLIFGDTQPRNQTEIDYIAHDVIEDLIGSDAAFGITLGDVVFDDLSLFDSIQRTIGLIGVPWAYVMGNHDTNHDAPDDERSDETWERQFGPAYYSFDHGPVHFIVLDNIMWRAASGSERAGYSGGLGAKQLAWLGNDLARVPRTQPVVLLMHIPIEAVAEKTQVFELLDDRPYTLSFSAHTHTQEHRFLSGSGGWKGKQPHHHVIHATVCGSWWSGAPDELGIPHATMSDGAPNGYSIVTFDRTRYTIEFRAARRPADYQMNIYAPEEVAVADLATTDVTVNVFAGSSRSRVEMRMGSSGPWLPMEQTRMADPAYQMLKEAEAGPNPPPGRKLPGISQSSHIWRARLPASVEPGTHRIVVRATDMFGKTHEASRILRVK